MVDAILTKGEHTRMEILSSAHQLFLKNGFHGTSMRQIAQGAGIAVGGIYNHFASKDEIFVAVLADRHPIYNILPAISTAEGQDIETYLRNAAYKMVEGVQGRADFLNLMFIELVEFNAQHIPELFQSFFPQVLSFTQRFFENRQELRPIPVPVLLRGLPGIVLLLCDDGYPDAGPDARRNGAKQPGIFRRHFPARNFKRRKPT